MSEYCYSPLLAERDSIRLLRLLPDTNKHSAIKCEIVDYSLELGGSTHLYEALSYVWGDPKATRQIFVGGYYINVTISLYSALASLRNHALERTLWVDAVCINQADEREKEQQIPLMAKIYGQAACVLVWLGENTDDSDQALQDISLAAQGEPISWTDEAKKNAILDILERPWFRRIWVLQEAAAARHILLLCGTTTINGHAFCEGLKGFDFDQGRSDLQNSIPAVLNLISGANLRLRYGSSSPSKISLGELLDMHFFTRHSTIPHDKIYALLGMSSHDPYAAGLSPSYQTPWDQLLRNTLRFIFHKDVDIETWEERAMAVIKSRGCIIGRVTSVERKARQSLAIDFTNRFWALQFKKMWPKRWTIEITERSIWKDDLVCLLQGASKPTIIRACQDYFTIIVLIVSPLGAPCVNTTVQGGSSTKPFFHNLMLVWNGEDAPKNLQDHKQAALMEIRSIVPEHRNTIFKKSENLIDVARMLHDAGKYESVESRLQLLGPDVTPSEEMLVNLIRRENFALMQIRARKQAYGEELLSEVLATRQQVQGLDHADTLNTTVNLATTYANKFFDGPSYMEPIMDWLCRIRDGVEVTEEVVCDALAKIRKESLELILDLKGDDFKITEVVVKAAVKNGNDGVLELLLDHHGEKIEITEEIVKVAARNRHVEPTAMGVLLNRRGDGIRITEDLLKIAVAENEFHGERILRLFFDQRGDEIKITEELVKAAAQNRFMGAQIMELLLDRGGKVHITEEVVEAAAAQHQTDLMEVLLVRLGNDLEITERVLIAAAGNEGCGVELVKLIFDHRGDSIRVTDKVIRVAESNSYRGFEIVRLINERSRDAPFQK